jgi:hypothetical protein
MRNNRINIVPINMFFIFVLNIFIIVKLY